MSLALYGLFGILFEMDQLHPSDPDELQRKAREYLAEAQKTTDLAFRNELLNLCEQVLREAAAVRQVTARNN